MRPVLNLVGVGALVVGGLAAGCGGDDDAVAQPAASNGDGTRPSVVVTTNILGDVVTEVLGEQADVSVIMPLGADPHDFAASTRQAEAMADADLLVINGAGFEEGMLEIIDSAEEAGAPVFAFADHVELLRLDEAHGDTADDPHIWTNPQRIATAVAAFADRAAELDGVDHEAVAAQAAAYVAELESLDSEIRGELATVPAERRVLVTNHEVFGYFADRYDFEVVGAVIPSLTTSAGASAADVEELAALIGERGVPAIFGETTQPTELAEALADEVGGDVEVVTLFTESLGEEGSGAETYVGMMGRNAQLLAEALS